MPPTLSSITKHIDSIQLKWYSSAGKDVAKYHVYRKVSNEIDFKKIASVSGTEHSYQEPVLKAYTSAAYRISAVDDFGNEGSPSKIMRWNYANKNTSFPTNEMSYQRHLIANELALLSANEITLLSANENTLQTLRRFALQHKDGAALFDLLHQMEDKVGPMICSNK